MSNQSSTVIDTNPDLYPRGSDVGGLRACAAYGSGYIPCHTCATIRSELVAGVRPGVVSSRFSFY